MGWKRLIYCLLAVLLMVGAASWRPAAACSAVDAAHCCDACSTAALNPGGCDTCQLPIWIGDSAAAPVLARHSVRYAGSAAALRGLDIAPDLPPPRARNQAT